MSDYVSYCNHLIVNDEVFYKKVGDKIELYSYGCPDSIWDLETIAQCIDQEKHIARKMRREVITDEVCLVYISGIARLYLVCVINSLVD